MNSYFDYLEKNKAKESIQSFYKPSPSKETNTKTKQSKTDTRSNQK